MLDLFWIFKIGCMCQLMIIVIVIIFVYHNNRGAKMIPFRPKYIALAISLCAMPITSAFADDAELKAQIDKLTRLVESQAEQLKSLQAQTNSLADQQVKTTEAI